MQVSHENKNMVEKSSTVPQSIYKEDLNHTLGLTLSAPSLVHVFCQVKFIKSRAESTLEILQMVCHCLLCIYISMSDVSEACFDTPTPRGFGHLNQICLKPRYLGIVKLQWNLLAVMFGSERSSMCLNLLCFLVKGRITSIIINTSCCC